jgi:isoleucyl-tRNA synthetase
MMNMQQDEERILRYWKEEDINNKVRKKNASGKKFYFLDGPPFVTGDLHPGQVWTKGLKDAFVRYKRYRGFNVVDRAGYDVHGLPIENKVEKELKITSKKEIEQNIGVGNFVSACKKFVERHLGRWESDYERFGISLDFSDPYLPYKSEYIETAWQLFKTISDKGFLYKDKRTLIYCPHCETPLSQGSMEVEYADEEDPSLFFTFEIDAKRSKPKIGLGDRTYLLVWTTTPWTIPSNVAVAANPKALYVRAMLDGTSVILAKDRLDKVSAALNRSVIVDKEFYGSELEDIYYVSPLEGKVTRQKELRRYHRIVFSESLVSMEEGTGLVHIAPGNGIEDYVLGKKNKLPVFCPVKPDATYSGDAGSYEGLKVPSEANEAIMRDLESIGALLGKSTVKHSYPHCWRCHSKLIFIATDQWFFNVQRIKNKMINANRKVNWVPTEAKSWEDAVIESAPDWCISRQRYWGIPMPVWECDKCGDFRVIGSVEELMAESRETAERMEELHRPHIDKVVFRCRKCGGEMHRVKDVLDGWFDSGITFRASLSAEQFPKLFPTDLILEYIEQTRAWFQYLLRCGIMAYGKAPYRNVVVHGIMFGTDGKKMSKSLGNYAPLNEMLKFVTADAFRLWCNMHPPILNRNLDDKEIKETEKAITILRNISNLLSEYQGILGYSPELKLRMQGKGLEPEDAWLLSKLEKLNESVTESMDRYDISKAAVAINDFIIEDFSRLYLKIAKRRMQLGGKRGSRKVIDIVNYVLYKTLVLISPITPFVAESVFRDRYASGKTFASMSEARGYDCSKSIFLNDWPKPNKRLMNDEMEGRVETAKEVITAILNSREKGGISLRMPVLSATVETGEDSVVTTIQEMESMIQECANVKALKVMKGKANRREIVPMFARLGPAFKGDSQAIADELKAQDADAVESAVLKDGYYRLHAKTGAFDIKPEHFTIVETPAAGNSSKFKFGTVSLDASQTEELKEESLIRELVRRIQLMRKELKLARLKKIRVHIAADPQMSAIIGRNRGQISKIVLADSVNVSSSLPGDKRMYQKDWEILKAVFSIGIESGD